MKKFTGAPICLLLVAFLSIIIPVNPVAAQNVPVRIMTSGGFEPTLKAVLPEFERATGNSITIVVGKSQGAGADTISAQLRRGVRVDAVILTREGMNDLIAQGNIVAHSDINIAKSPLGVAVRAGAPKPDISTSDALKKTLLHAKSIAYPGSTTSFYVVNKLFPKLGIASEVLAKSKNTGVASVASGDAELALQAVVELLHVRGTVFVGPVPQDVQYDTVFSAALVSGSNNSRKAGQLIAFLTSEKARAAIRDSGLEPVFAQGAPVQIMGGKAGQAGPGLAHALIGTWRVTRYSQMDVATQRTLYPIGEHPLGYVQFSPGGHVVVFITAGERAKRKVPYTDADLAAILREIGSAYIGTYTLQGDKLTVHEIAALRADNIGTDQTRSVALTGNHLTMKNVPSINGKTGKISITEISAEREE